MPVSSEQSQSTKESESADSDVLARLKSLESEFQDGNLTLKGYWKQKCSLFDPLLDKNMKESLKELNTELANEEITQKYYFKKLEQALTPIMESYKKEEVKENGCSAPKCNEETIDLCNDEEELKEILEVNGDAHKNGSSKSDFKKHIAGKLSKFQHGSQDEDMTEASNGCANSHSPRSKGKDDEGETNINGLKNGHSSDETKPKSDDKDSSKTKDEDDCETKEKDDDSDSVEANDSDSGAPPSKKSKGTPPSKTPNRRSSRIKVDSNQPSITSMFTQRTQQEKNQVEDSSKAGSDDEENTDSKRQRTESWKPESDSCNPVTINNSQSVNREKCRECMKFLDDPELKLFPGDPSDALEECLALIDSRLNLFTGNEDPDTLMDETPVHKITHFSVYDKHRHMCPFDMGLIEANKLLYFSGVLKPIFEDNPSPDDGVPCCDMGPINEWHIAGFDGGEKYLIGFTTGYGTYYLMEPSEAYSPVMEHVKVKVHLAKIVIEFVNNNEEATYEDMLNKIETTVPPPGVSSVTEDSLLRHAQFVVDRIQSYDDAANDEDLILLTTPCIRSLINLAGVTLGKKNKHGKAERRLKKKEEKPKHTMACVTPLVRSIFDSLFKEQIVEEMPKTKKTRCGTCEVCLLPDCGECASCKDMIKYGGSGRSKQACKARRCPNMAFKEAEDDDAADEEEILEEESKKAKDPILKHKSKKNLKTKVSWIGSPAKTSGKYKYYSKVLVNDYEISRSDFVTVASDDTSKPSYVARIETLFEQHGKSFAHVQWFMRGLETVLGVVSDPLEVFMVDDCEDIELISVMEKITVMHKKAPSNWSLLGGIDDPDADSVVKEDDGKTFFYQLFYHTTFGRFLDIPESFCVDPDQKLEVDCCVCCICNDEKKCKAEMALGKQIDVEDGSSSYRYFNSFRKNDQDYQIGDCCYIEPDGFGFKIKHVKTPKKSSSKDSKNLDEDIYPEAYRKSEYVKGSNDECPEPFRIGRISKIACKKSAGKNPLESEVKITVNKFYRVENTHKGTQAMYHSDLNQLYWSNEESNVAVSLVCGKCTVVYAVNIEDNLDDFFLSASDRFYFHDAYNADSRNFEDPPSSAKLMGSKAKGGGKSKGQGKGKGKGKGKGQAAAEESTANDWEEKSPSFHKLNTLDVFAGCGGLSEGFHQAGVARSCWAIEKEKPAAQAFRLNNSGCTVFTEDCNLLLQWVMEGQEKDNFGQMLPQKGDVELLCGGPPCQGFSGMNRFNSREYSKFKNSLIASYLSYCDYYRPRFFLLENVRNFVSFKSGMVLKLALRCLIRMGYQCTFGVLQAGCYGVAQTRRRAIILAAAPGEKLPFYPEPMHTFAPRAMQLTVMVDDKKYTSNIQNTVSTPLRTITVRDAMSDLPEIMNGASKDEIDYKGDPETHFQRLIRGKHSSSRPLLRDHICKEMNALVAARMRHIPLAPGSDWRDLPNIEVTLPDHTKTKKLLYSFPDKANGRSATGAKRGVCSCASGRVCDPLARQFNTLVPWCLPHTGNRHNHWSGLYGRLQWDGFFSTTITNPEPMGKQGRVLHPEQHRVVSVRECARSQGFPDTYKFFGSVLDKHRQVGNAVPPPMGRAIGLEIKKCLVWKNQEEAKRKKEGKKEVKEEQEEEGKENGHCNTTTEEDTPKDEKMDVDAEAESVSGGSSR